MCILLHFIAAVADLVDHPYHAIDLGEIHAGSAPLIWACRSHFFSPCVKLFHLSEFLLLCMAIVTTGSMSPGTMDCHLISTKIWLIIHL